ncbi:MAG: MFS transporter permease [Thermodesulfobacteriota bacterium]
MAQKPGEIIIPREKAVFYLDGQGCWRNEHGKFRNKKIIDYFHRAISRDENGYFVIQDKGGVIEKVYFPYEDTPLFAFDVYFGADVTLLLNTGKEIPLTPEQLFIKSDSLYLQSTEGLVKFTERALMKISDTFEEAEGRLFIRIGSRLYPIPEKGE